jgi:hypothetical protein
MKKIKSSNKPFIVVAILAAMMFIGTISAFADVVRNGDTFKVEAKSDSADAKKTRFTWEDKEGKTYPIYVTKNGACYVYRISKKTGKEYKYYLPKEVGGTIVKELNIKL